MCSIAARKVVRQAPRYSRNRPESAAKRLGYGLSPAAIKMDLVG
jgi:hypothetical protein